jgi:hypothetical protein
VAHAAFRCVVAARNPHRLFSCSFYPPPPPPLPSPVKPAFSITDYVGPDILHLGAQGVFKRAMELVLCAVDERGNLDALEKRFVVIGGKYWSSGVDTQESFQSLKLATNELPGRSNISLLRALNFALYDPTVIPDGELREHVFQFVEDVITIKTAVSSHATEPQWALVTSSVLPRLRAAATKLGQFDKPSGVDDRGKDLRFSKYHIYAGELAYLVGVWGSGVNTSMAVFEAANKDVATIAQHCLCPRKEFLKRLANSADVRYMFRYCVDDALGAAMVFPPSVSPERCRVTLPSRARSKVVLSRADAFWPVAKMISVGLLYKASTDVAGVGGGAGEV